MNTFSLHISIVLLAVIAVINCFPGGFDVNDEMAEQQYDPPQPSISQLLQLIEEKAVNQQDPEVLYNLLIKYACMYMYMHELLNLFYIVYNLFKHGVHTCKQG